MRGSRTGILAVLLLGTVLLVGISRLFVLRFEAGDVYPPYSSLRSDPLGTRVLYEGLGSCAGIDVSRCFDPLARLDLEALPPNTALLFLGDYLPSWDYATISVESANRINAFMRRGGRIVVTLQPSAADEDDEEDDDADQDEADATADEKQGADEEDEAVDDEDADSADDKGKEEEAEIRWDEDKGPVPIPRRPDKQENTVSMAGWLGTDITYAEIQETAAATATTHAVELGLPHSVTCRTTRCFAELDEDWHVMYARDGRPVVIERPMGDGTLVLSAPTYFVSNEALRDRRRTPLLLWLIGDSTTVVFDETHHGIQRPQGVAMLARRYRLHWFGAGLVVLALLFVWQSASSLVPPFAGSTSGPAVEFSTGKDSVSGLVNLLRRNIPPSRVLDTCIDEWQRSAQHTDTEAGRRLQTLREIARKERANPRNRRNLAGAYNRMARYLHERQRNRESV